MLSLEISLQPDGAMHSSIRISHNSYRGRRVCSPRCGRSCRDGSTRSSHAGYEDVLDGLAPDGLAPDVDQVKLKKVYGAGVTFDYLTPMLRVGRIYRQPTAAPSVPSSRRTSTSKSKLISKSARRKTIRSSAMRSQPCRSLRHNAVSTLLYTTRAAYPITAL